VLDADEAEVEVELLDVHLRELTLEVGLHDVLGTLAPPEEGPRHTHPVWEIGSYAPAGADGVELSTANDARIRYGVSQQGDTLTFTDPQGCQVQYRRQP
jgi:hypothetical protein